MASWNFEGAERFVVRFVGLVTLVVTGIKIILHELRTLW